MPLDVTRENGGIAVRFRRRQGPRGPVLVVGLEAGRAGLDGTVDGTPVAVQVRAVPNGFALLATAAYEARAYVYTEREAGYARLMPVKKAADTGKQVLCPMPGLVVSIAVKEGQEVKAGETLAVVEAMKMENVLRAEHRRHGQEDQREARRQPCGRCCDHGVRLKQSVRQPQGPPSSRGDGSRHHKREPGHASQTAATAPIA